jgi:hypothetical protein
MRRTSSHRLLLVAVAALCAAVAPSFALRAQQPAGADTLRLNFLNPPDEARPMVRWWWFGTAVTKPELLRELQQMKADGLGGAELAFVYPEVVDGPDSADPAVDFKNLPFLSPAMLDAVTYAQSAGRKLGLRIDVTLCSGWPFGGPNTTLAEAAMRLRFVGVALQAGDKFATAPTLKDGETLIAASVVQGNPGQYDAASAKSLQLTPGALAVPAGTGARTVLFFIQSPTRQQVKRAAVGAEGYVLDPFSHDAVAKHLRTVGESLVSAFGATPPYAIFSDSLEAYGADWTPVLPAEFLKRRGYDLMPHLPELVTGGTSRADTIRHDYGRTLKELVDENYLTQIDDWARAHGTKFRSQTYGDPAVSFSSQSLVALPEGEGPQWQAFSTLRWATSANHVFGNNVTSGETFTWLHSPVFRATPLDMKAEADVDFITGENQLIFHGWPYSPPASELTPNDPGWSLYAAGAFNDHNPWHPAMPAVTRYITRISALLRQGQAANQVAILLPTDDAWAAYSPGKVSVTDAMRKLVSPELMTAILSAGYNVDFIDADAIDKVGLGAHEILILPPTDRIPVSTLQHLHPWYKTAGQVICFQRCPTIDPEGQPLPGMKGSFIVADDLKALVKDMRDVAKPDLDLGNSDEAGRGPIGFIRRKLKDADIYFVANTSNEPMRFTATFATQHPHGESIDPDSGAGAALGSKTEVQLAPYESRIFVFSAANASADSKRAPETRGKTHDIADLSNDWKLLFTATGKSEIEAKLKDWTADPATLHYSGEVVYTRDVKLTTLSASPIFLEIDGGSAIAGAPNAVTQEHVVRGADGMPNPLVTGTGPGMHAWFDPPVREVAVVVINGKPAGTLWHPPYRLDVSSLLKAGDNRIEMHVYNTALNAWSALPPHDYGPLKAKYGDRFQMQDIDKVKPIPSGILGTIHLVTQEPR